jgi:hypothetical protein
VQGRNNSRGCGEVHSCQKEWCSLCLEWFTRCNKTTYCPSSFLPHTFITHLYILTQFTPIKSQGERVSKEKLFLDVNVQSCCNINCEQSVKWSALEWVDYPDERVRLGPETFWLSSDDSGTKSLFDVPLDRAVVRFLGDVCGSNICWSGTLSPTLKFGDGSKFVLSFLGDCSHHQNPCLLLVLEEEESVKRQKELIWE